MKNKDDSNIFDEASKRLGKKKKKKVKPAHSKEAISHTSQGAQPERPGMVAVADPEMEVMLKRLRAMDDDLQSRMNRICELSGMSKEEVARYIENPKNFSTFEWERMQKEKEVLEEKLYSSIGIQAKKRILMKKKKKIIKDRKGKTLGTRKGWIQM